MTIEDNSKFAHVLFLSGILGVAAAMVVPVYQGLLQDPVLYGGQQAVPSWTWQVFFVLLGTSFAALIYAFVLDTLFRGWFDIITGAAVLGQWGFPISFYLSTNAGVGNIISLFVIVFSVLNVLVALAVFGNYLRRGWE